MEPFDRPALPTTPKRGLTYQDLLQSFKTQNSATSVTQARRISSNSTPRRDPPTPSQINKQEVLSPSQSVVNEPPFLPSEKTSRAEPDASEDELQQSVMRTSKASARNSRAFPKSHEGLKMEMGKKEPREGGPRRSLRRKKDDILESDTGKDELASTPTKHKAPALLRLKPDTARQRLRDDIASQSKAKADNFLAEHKDYFLPLLPPNNYVSKLVLKAPIIEYKELTEQPRGVTAIMKPYQLSGLSFLVYLYNNGFSGILGDEMGLGKTLQTLSLFQYLEEQDKKDGITSEELRPYLVVCPLSVLNSWVNEAQKWVPGLKVLSLHGTLNERNRLKKIAGLDLSKLSKGQRKESYKIIITTYETFQAEQNWFKHSFIWRFVVLDEGHRIKNNITNISNSLKSVSAEYRLILTGTPLQNNLVELWSLLAWLYPNVFTENTATLFKDSFDLGRGKVNQQTMDDARRLLELVMLRRMKDSEGVNLNLPPKEEVLLYVPLTPMQRFWYTRLLTRVGDSLLDDLFTNIQNKEKDALQKEKQDEWKETEDIMRDALQKEEQGPRNAWQKLMNLVMQLRKCCSHPYLLPGASPDPYYLGDHVIRASGKFILLEKLLRNSIYKEGKKVLIFSGFTRTLDCCEDLLTLIGDHGRGFKYLRLDGGTARARRNLDIRLFNHQSSDYKVMLLSTRAGGLGINLTSAEDVIFLDEDWNPQITLQAEARAHRIGQTKKVTIYKLCTQGTVEEQMLGRIRKKLYLSAKITESMRNIQTKGRGSTTGATEEMPQMDTSQLKSLVRRGAQTLSHEIDVTEMISWNLDTMLQKCRNSPSDPLANTDIDEEKWLSAMERVECAVFDGKRYQRQIDKTTAAAASILPSSVSREDRRKGKNVTVMVDGFAISKESLNCADWEAVPTFAGKDPRLADPKREKRRAINHEEHCLVCFDSGDLVSCKGCPRSYHVDCLEEGFRNRTQALGGFYCPQHECVECNKKTSDAGGLIYRCRWCENGFCEDCLEWGKEDLIGENLPEFEMLGEPPSAGAFYIKCPVCKESAEDDEERKEWMEGMEMSYKEQHELWLQNRDKEQKMFEEEREQEQKAALRRNKAPPGVSPLEAFQNGFFFEDTGSPPALTDTSIPTPAPGESGVSTPSFLSTIKNGDGTKRKSVVVDEDLCETREEKRARLGQHIWEFESDPLLRGLENIKGAENFVYMDSKKGAF